MESKLNKLAIDTYNTAFTNRVVNDFYARHEKIDGEQILKLSPVPQVNLFVIKNLFQNWQSEATRLRSPYFNYQHPKVQEAQKVYMNTLSRHISISEPHLRPLLQEAVYDTLLLIFFPIEYIRKALQASNGSPQEVNEILRYVKINQAYAQEAKNILNRQDVTDSLWLDSLCEELKRLQTQGKLEAEQITPFMQQFSEVLALRPSEILIDEELEKQNEEEDDDFFSSVTRSFDQDKKEEKDEPVSKPEPDPTPVQQTQAAPAPDEDLPSVNETAPRHAEFRRTEPDLSNKTPDIRISEAETQSSPEEKQNKTLNERFGKEYKSLNEKLSPATGEKAAIPPSTRKKAANIRSLISLNQRFMFTNELFEGDTQAFNQALDQLEGFDSYEQAYQYTIRHYGRNYNWKLEEEASQEFFEILQSRFA